jgi:hypothetical protein
MTVIAQAFNLAFCVLTWSAIWSSLGTIFNPKGSTAYEQSVSRSLASLVVIAGFYFVWVLNR